MVGRKVKLTFIYRSPLLTLMEAARMAVRHMIDYLQRTHGLSRPHAYMLCSVAVDLKLCEVVDAPHWVVSAFLPQSIFMGQRP